VYWCGCSSQASYDLHTLQSLKKDSKVKVKFTHNRSRRPRGRVEVSLYSFFNLDDRWGGWSTPRPGRFTPGRTQYPLYRRLGGPQSRIPVGAENLAPNGFDPRTVPPVVAIPTVLSQPTTKTARSAHKLAPLCTCSHTRSDTHTHTSSLNSFKTRNHGLCVQVLLL
jgi:hypothetical protein